MNKFIVRVRTSGARVSYTDVGTDSAAVHMAAIDRYGVCAVTVQPVKE